MKVEFNDFTQLLQTKGHELYRDMPWRTDTRPYYILVSEVMLQQTQVERVMPKFERFVDLFPDEQSLATAPLSEVLRLWQGLGYNRRAKFLHQAAQKVVAEFGGVIPSTSAELSTLPGVGRSTAGAILAYAFNQPVLFIETNIRTVYFHHFFNPLDNVSDTEILPLLEQTLDRDHPRQFYWALMDYGSALKRQGIKNVGQSKHYRKQSKLEGSVRQVRGQIIRLLTQSSHTAIELEQAIDLDERFDQALSGLVRDGLVEIDRGRFKLTDEQLQPS